MGALPSSERRSSTVAGGWARNRSSLRACTACGSNPQRSERCSQGAMSSAPRLFRYRFDVVEVHGKQRLSTPHHAVETAPLKVSSSLKSWVPAVPRVQRIARSLRRGGKSSILYSVQHVFEVVDSFFVVSPQLLEAHSLRSCVVRTRSASRLRVVVRF